MASVESPPTPLVHKQLAAHNGVSPTVAGRKDPAEGRFDKQDFIYIAEDDEYRCPAGERAIKRFTTVENGLTIHKYWASACPKCLIKAQCTTGNYRRITRCEHEAVLEAMH